MARRTLQVIVKEERQLNEPKPVVAVKHVWNPEDLAGRPTSWKEHVRVRKTENTDKMSVRQQVNLVATGDSRARPAAA